MITLTRIDPSRNLHRYYTVAIQPDLFGGYQLVRQWGRIGTSGQYLTQSFDTLADAMVQHRCVLTAKRKRGYE